MAKDKPTSIKHVVMIAPKNQDSKLTIIVEEDSTAEVHVKSKEECIGYFPAGQYNLRVFDSFTEGKKHIEDKYTTDCDASRSLNKIEKKYQLK